MESCETDKAKTVLGTGYPLWLPLGVPPNLEWCTIAARDLEDDEVDSDIQK